jgi:hypothetical protein
MGADFISATCKVSRDKDGALAALAMIPDTTLDALFEELFYDPPEEDEPAAREYFATAVNTFYDDYVHGSDREVDLCTFGGERYVVTGGMSWGDSPTGAYDIVRAVDMVGVTRTTDPAADLAGASTTPGVVTVWAQFKVTDADRLLERYGQLDDHLKPARHPANTEGLILETLLLTNPDIDSFAEYGIEIIDWSN